MESQLQIWEHVAGSAKDEILKGRWLIYEVLRRVQRKSGTLSVRFVYKQLYLNLHYLYIFRSRRSLMRTRRLARPVTMKAWKEDFMAVEIVEKKEGTDFEYMQKAQSELGFAWEVKVLKWR